jgi:hypothetical protein
VHVLERDVALRLRYESFAGKFDITGDGTEWLVAHRVNAASIANPDGYSRQCILMLRNPAAATLHQASAPNSV